VAPDTCHVATGRAGSRPAWTPADTRRADQCCVFGGALADDGRFRRGIEKAVLQRFGLPSVVCALRYRWGRVSDLGMLLVAALLVPWLTACGAPSAPVPLAAPAASPATVAPYLAPARYDPKRMLCLGDSTNKLVTARWAEAEGRPPKVTSEGTAIPKDDAGKVRVAVDSYLREFGGGDLGFLDAPTKARLDAVLAGYPERAVGFSASDMARLPRETRQTVESAIRECVPDFVILSTLQQDLIRSQAIVSEHVANWRHAKVYWNKQPEIEAKIRAENEASLKREVDAAIGKLRDCLSVNVTGLAVVSTEPAEVIVQAAYAACRPQREAAKAIYNRQRSDPGAGDRIMDGIERGVMGHWMLTVIQARAANRRSPSTQAPSAPPSQPAPKENSI
jgi:hypothetical protein